MKQENARHYNPINERLKYKYRSHKLRSKRKDKKTVIAELKHLREYEIFTSFEEFSCFNDVLADRYIRHMQKENLSLSYMNESLRSLREFLTWLSYQKGYRSKIDYNHIEYLYLSNNQRRTAKTTEYKRAYTFQQILHTIRNMPSNSIIEKRNKAMISLQALCGLRIGELRTIKLKNLIEEEGDYFIYVNPKDMHVKYAKNRQANFMPLPEDIKHNVLSWHTYLKSIDFAGSDPLFPIIPKQFNQRNLLESKIKKETIKSDTSIRNIFKNAFLSAGYEYLRPHSFRHTIARYAEKKSPEFLNAVRQSLGHSSIHTTFQSYGDLSEYEQRRRISSNEILS